MTWQPIETAPKDGEDFLAYGAHLGCLVVSYDEDYSPGFPYLTLDGPCYRAGAFTHWMPLPEPPR